MRDTNTPLIGLPTMPTTAPLTPAPVTPLTTCDTSDWLDWEIGDAVEYPYQVVASVDGESHSWAFTTEAECIAHLIWLEAATSFRIECISATHYAPATL
jgi:hypothetical protein